MAASSLITERLHLRRLQEGDHVRLATLINNWDIVRWLAVVPFPYALKDAEEFFRILGHGGEDFFVIADKADDLLMGGISLRPKEGEAEMGYWLAEAFWGRGFMTEAAQCITRYGFDELEMKRIIAWTHQGNDRSRHVLEKSGFTYCGLREPPPRCGKLRGTDEVHFYEKLPEKD